MRTTHSALYFTTCALVLPLAGVSCTVGEARLATDGAAESRPRASSFSDGCSACNTTADGGAIDGPPPNGRFGDGGSDECIVGAVRACDTQLAGACAAGTQICAAGKWGSCTTDVKPAVAAEICDNGADDDCDGDIDLADRDCEACAIGSTRACATGFSGVCADGVQTCGSVATWRKCAPNTLPGQTAEECANTTDDDCDGLVDSQDPDCQKCAPTTSRTCDTQLPGVCAAGTQRCALLAGGVWDWEPSCAPTISPASQAEDCSGNDDRDCDGKVPPDDPDCFCFNGNKDGDETDVDCGGSCEPCPLGATCSAASDCTSGNCAGPLLSGGCTGIVVRAFVGQGNAIKVGCDDGGSSVKTKQIALAGFTANGGCNGLVTRSIVGKGASLQIECDDGERVRSVTMSLTGATATGSCGGSLLGGGSVQIRAVQAQGNALQLSCYNVDSKVRSGTITFDGPSTCK